MRRIRALCSRSSSGQRGPRSTACEVESTRSVKSTVASTRLDSRERLDSTGTRVRNPGTFGNTSITVIRFVGARCTEVAPQPSCSMPSTVRNRPRRSRRGNAYRIPTLAPVLFRRTRRRYDRAVLVGRGAERDRIDALLALARTGSGGALVLRGEPGIGKSALLRYAEECADGMRVL